MIRNGDLSNTNMGWVSVTMGDWMNFWIFLKPDMDLSMGYVPNPRFVQKVQLPAFLGLSVFLTGDAAGADFTFNLNHHTHKWLENVRTAKKSQKQLCDYDC
jgi:hypothetical protein